MKLEEVEVKLYRNIVNSGKLDVEDSITCLVGQNESGKTAFLEALYYLNPAFNFDVKVINDYPRWRKIRDESNKDLADVAPIEAVFSLEDEDKNWIEDALNITFPHNVKLHVNRTYNKTLQARFELSEEECVNSFMDSDFVVGISFNSDLQTMNEIIANLKQLKKGLDKRTNVYKKLENASTVARKLKEIKDGTLPPELQEFIETKLPTFFYYSSYSPLEGHVDLTELLEKYNEKDPELNENEQTVISLLELAGMAGDELLEDNFEERIAQLEAAANEITRQVLDYWTQNKDILVELHTDLKEVNDGDGGKEQHRFLDIRLKDLRHHVSTNFSTRSTGFQWFFSFIVAFHKFESRDDVIILLDEPGLGLHARAQDDLLRFIKERLSNGRQVIYTNHSPFMVDSKHLEYARLVEDLSSRENPDIGSKISKNVLSVKHETLFPLQAALGYDLAQNLFVGVNNLVVEGPSDLIYLTTLSEYLEEQNMEFLNEKITIVPVGGIDKIPTFIALLGAHVDVSILIDGNASQNQRLQDLIGAKILNQQRLISISQITHQGSSNIEDIFEEEEYLKFYNKAYAKNVLKNELRGTDSIIKRLERINGGEFDHLKPATVLLKERTMGELSDNTFQRFEELFKLINGTFDL